MLLDVVSSVAPVEAPSVCVKSSDEELLLIVAILGRWLSVENLKVSNCQVVHTLKTGLIERSKRIIYYVFITFWMLRDNKSSM